MPPYKGPKEATKKPPKGKPPTGKEEGADDTSRRMPPWLKKGKPAKGKEKK